MGKSTLFKSFLLATTLLSMFSTAQANTGEYQRIRIFQSDEQFHQAVAADAVFVSLPKNLLLRRSEGEENATKKIESVLAMRGPDGKVTKELVVRCEISMPSNRKSLILPNTKGTANPWKVMGVQTIEKATGTWEKWELGREGSERVSLTCQSFEREDGEMSDIALTPSMVNRALETVSGSVLTSVQPAELALDSRPYNEGLLAPAASLHLSPVRQ